jgi:tetratricopeptide (TPR) repeat protein
MPAKVAPRERLSFQIIDFDNEKATIVLEWARTRVAFIVTVNTNEQALKSIEKVLNPSSGSYAQGARFALEQMGDVEKAQDWAQKSIDLEETWYNNWIMGNILAKKNNYTDALTYMQKALELGNQNPERFFYKDKVEKAIEEWKGK